VVRLVRVAHVEGDFGLGKERHRHSQIALVSADVERQPIRAWRVQQRGRRRERFPEASVYNRLCDLEWDTSIGEARSCGGDFLARAGAFRDAGVDLVIVILPYHAKPDSLKPLAEALAPLA
jgi:hypothetical protein